MTYRTKKFTVFRRVRRIAKIVTSSFVMSIRPSVRPHGTTRLPLDGFSSDLIFEHFLKKDVKKIQVSLNSEKKNEYFTWRALDIFDHISLSSS
jgi:hypothetical protein